MDGRGEEKDIGKQLLTSFGLFFAGATPVKPDRNGEKEKRRLPVHFECTIHQKKGRKNRK